MAIFAAGFLKRLTEHVLLFAILLLILFSSFDNLMRIEKMHFFYTIIAVNTPSHFKAFAIIVISNLIRTTFQPIG